MAAFVGDGSRRTDVRTAQAGDTVFRIPDKGPVLFFVIVEDVCGADIHAQAAATAGLLVYLDFHHQPFLRIVLGLVPCSVITISRGMAPMAWVAQDRQGS